MYGEAALRPTAAAVGEADERAFDDIPAGRGDGDGHGERDHGDHHRVAGEWLLPEPVALHDDDDVVMPQVDAVADDAEEHHPRCAQEPPDQVDDLAKAGGVLTHSGYDLNWVPLPLFYLVLAAIGLVIALRSPKTRAPAVFLIICVGLGITQLLAPDMTLTLHLYTLTLGRLFLPTLAAFVLLAITVPPRYLRPFWYVIVWVQLFISERALIKAWGTVNLAALGAWLAFAVPLVLVAVGAVVLGLRTRDGTPAIPAWGRALIATAAVLALLAAFGPAVEHVRGEYRYDEYKSIASGDSYRLHPNRLGELCSWPLWKAADQAHGQVIALAFGWRRPEGDNQMQYPFLGSRLQNTVTYVLITKDGHIVNYVSPAARGFIDADAWLGRLRAQHVDYVALLPPLPPETAIVARRPDIFRPSRRVRASTTSAPRRPGFSGFEPIALGRVVRCLRPREPAASGPRGACWVSKRPGSVPRLCLAPCWVTARA